MTNSDASTSDRPSPIVALVVTTPAHEVEWASDHLWSRGVAAIEERIPRDSSTGRVELWTSVGDDPRDIDAAVAGFAPGWTWRLETVDRSVVDTWRDHVRPRELAPGWIVVPAWGDHPPDERYASARRVLIDPGEAFGMGDHPTTMATAQALMQRRSDATRVLDVGCGSGILGICAAMAGAREVLAIDIASVAVQATRDNARRNGVGSILEATVTPLFEIEGSFDLVLANLLAPILIDLSDDLRRVTAPTGTLIVSGILTERHDHVLEALTPLVVVDTLEIDGWVAVVLEHPRS